VLVALGIGVVFWWSAESGQFDDLEGPGNRILMDDDQAPANPDVSTNEINRLTADAELPPRANLAQPLPGKAGSTSKRV
jgi:cbb3-type cytochrome oxidase maturation protein